MNTLQLEDITVVFCPRCEPQVPINLGAPADGVMHIFCPKCQFAVPARHNVEEMEERAIAISAAILGDKEACKRFNIHQDMRTVMTKVDEIKATPLVLICWDGKTRIIIPCEPGADEKDCYTLLRVVVKAIPNEG